MFIFTNLVKITALGPADAFSPDPQGSFVGQIGWFDGATRAYNAGDPSWHKGSFRNLVTKTKRCICQARFEPPK